jgi:CubicO group peptidase (beta-lactamase class C family)
MQKVKFILLLMFVPLLTNAQTLDQEKLEQGVGALFAEKSIDNTTPGCAVGVIEGGKWVLRKSYGMANLEHNIPITSESIFRTGSLSKQFTAAVSP